MKKIEERFVNRLVFSIENVYLVNACASFLRGVKPIEFRAFLLLD